MHTHANICTHTVVHTRKVLGNTQARRRCDACRIGAGHVCEARHRHVFAVDHFLLLAHHPPRLVDVKDVGLETRWDVSESYRVLDLMAQVAFERELAVRGELLQAHLAGLPVSRDNS